MKMLYLERLQNLDLKPIRPEHAEGLLLYPIADDPLSPGATSDEKWAKEHCLEQRFYVGGWEWFVDLTGISIQKLTEYKKRAALEAKSSGWPALNGATGGIVTKAKGQWGAIAPQQFFNVAKNRPVLFPKAALFILACELALSDLLEARENPDDPRYAALAEEDVQISGEITTGCEVYRHMSIVGACWNINDFNNSYVQKKIELVPTCFLELSSQFDEQQPTALFEEITAGHTITYPTARKIKDYADNTSPPEVGDVRAKSGKKLLGTKKAAPSEIVSLN